MKHLAERDAAQGRVDEVVQGRVVGLAEILPGAAAEGRHGRRLIEAQAVGPACREVVVALIRVADLVDGEVVQVPDPPLLHVVPPCLGRDPRRHLPANEVRHSVHHVDDGGLKQGPADTARGTALARAPLDDPGGLAWCLRGGGRIDMGHRVGHCRWRAVRVGGRRFRRTLRGAQGDAPEQAPQHHDSNTPDFGTFELGVMHFACEYYWIDSDLSYRELNQQVAGSPDARKPCPPVTWHGRLRLMVSARRFHETITVSDGHSL